jgi:hypothetical protein
VVSAIDTKVIRAVRRQGSRQVEDADADDAAHDERHRRGQAELRTPAGRLAGWAGGLLGNLNVIRHVYP